MPFIDKPYTPGTPCWIDLMAKDQQLAMDFYMDLFGWEGEKGPEEFGGYAVMNLNGHAVAGIGPAMAPEGMPEPPHVWTTYLASDDADATAQRISAAHGTLLFPPMDVGTVGRMIVAQDPTGAVFGVWQPKDFFGAQVVNEPGALTWNECNTRDVPAAAAFYKAAFDLDLEPMEGSTDNSYQQLTAKGRQVGAMQDMAGKFPDEVPSHWSVWFAVDDRDATVDAAVKRGANVVVPPMEIPVGHMAGLQDPWGAVFYVIKLTM